MIDIRQSLHATLRRIPHLLLASSSGEELGPAISRLPVSLRIVLESVLRHSTATARPR